MSVEGSSPASSRERLLSKGFLERASRSPVNGSARLLFPSIEFLGTLLNVPVLRGKTIQLGGSRQANY